MSYASQLYDRDEYSSQSNNAWQEEQYSASSSNRSRLDSGSFSNSSGSTDGKKKRRSHRPRGCRGGGARRARKALREQARAREALQENVVPPCDHSSEYPPKYVTGNTSQGEVFKEKQLAYRDLSPAPSLQPCISTLSNQSCGSYTGGDLFSIFTPAAPPSAATNSNHYVDSKGNAHTRVPYGQMTHSDPHRSNTLASNHASRETSSSLSMFNTLKTHPTAEQPRGMGVSFVNVLPPLPIDDTEEEPDKLEGPNPYSLKSSLHPDEDTYQPSSSTLHPDAELYTPSLETSSNDSEDHLEKQRNMLSGSGSLFVTSPPSFLTGGRKATSF